MTAQHKNYTEEELGYPTEAHGRIPAFANREEEAAFWDTHDVTDFVGEELQPVEVAIGGDLAERLTLRLDQADRQALARRAKAKGVGPSTLARMWLKERLRQEAAADPPVRRGPHGTEGGSRHTPAASFFVRCLASRCGF